jgi:hypothetical protein
MDIVAEAEDRLSNRLRKLVEREYCRMELLERCLQICREVMAVESMLELAVRHLRVEAEVELVEEMAGQVEAVD